MKSQSKKKRLPILFSIQATLIFLFVACAGPEKKVAHEPEPHNRFEVKQLLQRLKVKNAGLKTFKGIGKIKLWENGSARTVRSAWMGDCPKKIRIAVLGAPGQTIITIASDGKWLYMRSHANNRLYKKKIKKANLNIFVAMPVKPEDLIALITGRTPIYDHKWATLKRKKSGEGFILSLKKSLDVTVQKIHFDKEKKIMQKIEIFDSEGNLSFRAIPGGVRSIKDYSVPKWIAFSNNDGAVFHLDIERYWVDVPVSSSKFSLKPGN